MLRGRPMFRLRLALSVAIVAAATLVPAVAAAQSVSASGQPYPNRIIGGVNKGYSTRAQNLNPLGISYQDCLDDMTLSFSVTLTGFTASAPMSLEVWASLTVDCTANTDRGIGATAAVCWGTGSGNTLAGVVNATPQTYTFNMRVQDLVGWQQGPPAPPGNIHPPAKGQEACTAQASFSAVPMNINFLAIDSSGNSNGTPYQYTLNTDMVGPPAPSGVGETVGETIYNVTWTANSDSDTAGYDVFMDPIPGQEGAETSISLEAGQKQVCPDTGAVSIGDATVESGGTDSSVDGPLETSSVESGVSEASVGPLPYDGGCYPVNTGGQSPASANGYNCNNSILAGALTQDGGAEASTVVTTPTVDDAGNPIEGGTVETGVGGISTIPAQFILNVPVGTSGFTIADKSVGSYTIKGLMDFTTYTVVVASVDGTGNVGPPSLEVCDYPAPVRDFWQTYREDGGQSNGFCALETIGSGGAPSLAAVACFLGLAAAVRRRRRSRR
jgi:hypothetical protein